MTLILVLRRVLSPRPLGEVRRCHHIRRSAFTLFELILAIALSVTLVALVGTAINLYLARVDGSRTQVEEAQLARSILAMIADDIRATTIYQPQDTSALAAMAASGAFDVDSVDEQRSGGGGGGGGGAGGGGGDVDDIDAPSASSNVSGSGTSAGSGFGASSSGASPSGAGFGGMGGASDDPATTMPLGLNGGLTELYVDATRLPRREEIFGTVTGYTNAPMGLGAGAGMGLSAATAGAAGVPQPSDLKSVRYFIRPGQPVEAGSVAVTSLSPEAQLRAGGLVRQEIPRRMRVWAEQSGNTMLLESGQALVAPEVVHIEFRYFDGTQVTDVWDMVERNSLPLAIEVRLWIAPTGSDLTAGTYDPVSLANIAREYRQTVFLPMSQVANSAAAMGTSGTTYGSGTGTSGMSSGSGMGSGSSNSSSSGASFNQP